MRRQDRAISEEESLAILERAEYGILSTIAEDGAPYGVPLNFCLIGRCIYFHCAPEGRKLVNIGTQARVSFCAVGRTELLPEKFSTKYESVIVSGTIREMSAADKQKALEGLVKKYSADFIDQGSQYIERAAEKTRVFEITIETISGKARR
jgi:nitroimidazol reductase NimA-like FMN-containing flavoprotein (pyridoxamine 5'-phosphate oxidase superfamily)